MNLVFFVVALATGGYLLSRCEEIALSGGITNELDVVIGAIIVGLVM